MATYRNLNKKQEDGSNENDSDISSSFSSVGGALSRSSGETSGRSFSTSYFSVKGSQSEDGDMSSQISKADPQSSTLVSESNMRSFSSSILSVEGSPSEESGTYAEIDESNIADAEIRNENQCCKCKKKATHFCESCKKGRNYICHVCLQDHNFWNDDHNVVSLSVDNERNSPLKAEDLESRKLSPQFKQILSDKRIVQSRDEMAISKDLTAKGKDDSHNRKSAPKGKMLGRKKFYKDTIYRDILREQGTGNQQSTDDEKLKKFGTYSIRTRSDKKQCFIVGITQLENKNILLADSDNMELKILDNENFGVKVSYELPDNPYLMCFVGGNKVFIAFVNFEFALVDLTDGMDIENQFKLKHMFQCIAYSKKELFACTADTFQIYSEAGQQISKIKPADVTAIEDICVNKEGDTLYCADKKKGVVIFDRHGHVVDVISDDICSPHRLCLSRTGNLYVTEKESKRVLKVDISKRNAKQVEQEDLYIKHNPISLCYEKTNNRLIVALWQRNDIHVYSCP